MFSAFLIITIPPTAVNAIVPKFFQNMMLWMVREHPSRIYNWFAFSTAQVVGEIPMAIVSSLVYWLLWYWPSMSAQPQDTHSSTAGYVFLMTMLFFLFMSSWGQWITAFAPNFTVISNVLPIFFVVFGLFNGVVRPWASYPVIWKYWLFWLNPSTYWIQGVLSSVLHNVPVDCAENETAKFSPPSGLTCGEYAGAFVESVGSNLLNPGATDICQVCQLTSGDQYLAQLHIKPSDKWRNFGVFLAFVVSNYMLVYFFIYTVRVKGWSFGMGWLFGLLGKIADFILKPFKKLAARRRTE